MSPRRLAPFSRLIFRAAGILLALTLVACVKERSYDSNTLYWPISDDVKTMDPANASDQISLEVIPSIYETLYQYSYLKSTYVLEPLLAESLPQVSKDGLTVTIRIKPGIHFSDDPCFKETHKKGRELVADDFIYAWKRLSDPNLTAQGAWIFEEKIADMKAVDATTIQLKLTRPYPQLSNVLAMTYSAPLAHECVQKYGDSKGNYADHPVGTGPFVLKKWDRNKRIVLDRNPNYRNANYPADASTEFRSMGLANDAGQKIPFLDHIQFEIIKETQPQWLQFLKGSLDGVSLPKEQYSNVIMKRTNLKPEFSEKGLRLHIFGGLRFYFVEFNMKDELIGKNKKLRQALSCAIDRERWIETFTNGRGSKMLTALPEGIDGRVSTAKIHYDFDLKKAKALLAEAGYPRGKGLPTLQIDMRSADSFSRQLGEFFSQSFDAIGVKTQINLNTFPAFLEKVQKGHFQMSHGGWIMDYPDAENAYQLLVTKNAAPGPNTSNFSNPEFDRFYEKMAAMPPSRARSALIERMDAILQEETPWALGYDHQNYFLTQPWVLNYRGSELIQNRFKYLKVDPSVKKRYLESSEGR